MIRVCMIPGVKDFGDHESGIRRVVEYYEKYSTKYGIKFDNQADDFDVFAPHAGMVTRFPNSVPIVSHLHGLYWTADYEAQAWEWKANKNVVMSARVATIITVPSPWVAETIERDMRVKPRILPHGIEWDEWQHDYENSGYVLWNKNRNVDVCNPYAVGELAQKFPEVEFVTTFSPGNRKFPNVKETGVLPHSIMKEMVQKAGVYLSTTKETFGIGTLEALASGVPVLGFAHGGNLSLVEHGVDGFLARPGDYDALNKGLRYCIENRNVLSANAKELSKQWKWDLVVKQLADIYKEAVEIFSDSRRTHTL